MEVRLVNIPSDAGAGLGVFENLHGFTHPGEFADHLRDAAKRVYGTPALMFKAPDGQVAIVRDGRVQFAHEGLPHQMAPLDARTIAEVQALLR